MQSRHQATKKKMIQVPVSIEMNTAPIYTTNWRKFRLISLPPKMLAFIGTFEKFFCWHMFWKFPCHIMCSTLCTPENDKRQKNKFLLSPWHFCEMQGSKKKTSKSCGPLLHSLRPTEKKHCNSLPFLSQANKSKGATIPVWFRWEQKLYTVASDLQRLVVQTRIDVSKPKTWEHPGAKGERGNFTL